MELNLALVNQEQYHKIWRSFVPVPRCSQCGLNIVWSCSEQEIKRTAWIFNHVARVNKSATELGGEKHGA